MSYNDDSVLNKLSALSETQDSIVTVAQWIMFHRRYADRTVQLWLQRLKDSNSHKRLNLLYLANEVTQQSKARHKEDFLVAFSPAIAEAVSVAYKGAPTDIQNRVRRVVDVWRERGVFEEPIQAAVEARMQELDKVRGTAKVGLGGTMFGGGASATTPSELTPLIAPQQSVTKLAAPLKTTIDAANQDFEKLLGPTAAVPSAPVYAARLSGLLKTLAQAEGAVEQCVKARRELVRELEKILDANRTALVADEGQLDAFENKKAKVEDAKNEVERAIMAGLPDDEPYAPVGGFGNEAEEEPDRPEVEELTPPPTEEPAQAESESNGPTQEAAPGADPSALEFISNIAAQYKSVPAGANGNKKRRLDEGEEYPGIGAEGIDADVAESLRRDSNSGA